MEPKIPEVRQEKSDKVTKNREVYLQYTFVVEANSKNKICFETFTD